jgi:hypothetical protein
MTRPSESPSPDSHATRRGPSSSDVCAVLMVGLPLLLALLRLCVV